MGIAYYCPQNLFSLKISLPSRIQRFERWLTTQACGLNPGRGALSPDSSACPDPQSHRAAVQDEMIQFSSVQFSRSVVSDSLRPHESQHARSPCPSPTPGVHSDSCPSSQWCHPAISSSVIPFSSCPESLPAWVFSNKSALHMRWPKYWSFSLSINPSKEYPGLISFRMDWLGLPIFYTSILPEPLGHWVFIQTCLSHSKILVQR